MLRNPSLKGALRQTMDRLIRTQDVKSLMLGAAGVAAVGLLCGAAMQPNLRAPGDAEGAQLQAGVSGPRAYGLADAGAAWTSYANGIPDYVIGTDWLQPPQYDASPPPDDAFAGDASAYAHASASAFDELAYAPAAIARYEEPPREPTRFPSLDGGQAFAAQAAATTAVATEPMETSLDPEAAELAAATPG